MWAAYGCVSVKTLDTKGSVVLPWLAISIYIVPYPGWMKVLLSMTWQGEHDQSSAGGPLLGPVLHALPFTHFNLVPFPIINCNHEYNSFQWILWALLVKHQTWGDLFELAVRVWGPSSEDCSLRSCSLASSSCRARISTTLSRERQDLCAVD